MSHKLVVRCFRLKTIGNQVWNGLPLDITSAQSLLTFKKTLEDAFTSTVIYLTCTL